MNYIENIKGCLTKYDDRETAKKWIFRASTELSSGEFSDFVSEINEFSIQTEDKYAETLFSSIASVNPNALILHAINFCDDYRSKAIIEFAEHGGEEISGAIRREINSVLALRAEQSRQHEERLKAEEDQRRRAQIDAERNRQAGLQKVLKQAAEAQRRKSEAAAEAASLLNKSRQFDLLLFDLDDTLIKSSHLEQYRGRENVGNQRPEYIKALVGEVEQLQNLIPEEVLQEIRTSFPDIRLGIFTRAPKAYAKVLLANCFPTIKWDCVIAYEDVPGRTKPNPSGIYAAAKVTNVQDMSRVALVGDETNDIIAAYQAGAFAVLFRQGWDPYWYASSDSKKQEHYRALEMIPDAMINRLKDIVQLITQPWKLLPTLESWDAVFGAESFAPGTRVDERKHFKNLQRSVDGVRWVNTKVMGRYFAAHRDDNQFDFRPKSITHKLSLKLLDTKEDEEFPDSWVACCVSYISSLAGEISQDGRHLVVCPVPARPGRHARMERLVERIGERMGLRSNLTFGSEILRYKEGVRPNKELDQDHRFMNVRDHLEIADNSRVIGKDVMVIDDVVTSGATFFYADEYLRAAGALNVHCVALAQTVSSPRIQRQETEYAERT